MKSRIQAKGCVVPDEWTVLLSALCKEGCTFEQAQEAADKAAAAAAKADAKGPA